jgi:hypothetical protein
VREYPPSLGCRPCGERPRHEMEDAMSHLELLMKPIMEVEEARRNPPALTGGGK